MEIYETPSLPEKVPLQDPDLRNGLQAKRLSRTTELPASVITTWPDIQGNPSDNARLLALLTNFQLNLGYIPLSPLRNLEELTDPAQAVSNLGLALGGANDIWLAREGGAMTGLLVLGYRSALQFQASANLALAQQGFQDSDGKHLYFTHVSTRRPHAFLTGGITTAVTVAASTTETDLFSADLDANMLAEGSIFKAALYGRYTNADGAATLTIRFKLNGVTILSVVTTAGAVTDGPLFAEFMNTARAVGASGSIWSYVHALLNNVAKDKPGTAAASIDTTAAITVSATAQWSNNNAGNALSLDQTLLNLN